MIYTRIPEDERDQYRAEFCDNARGCDSSDRTCNGFVCTRAHGHTGPHIAHGSAINAIAKWYEWDYDIELDNGL